MRVLADGPVIPNFGQGSSCERANGWWCTHWLDAHWGDTLQPALVQHIELSLIAVAIGFAISAALALVGFRRRLLDAPIGAFADFLYTIPSLALFQLLVPLTGLTVTTVEIALVSYTLLILFRNTLAGLDNVPEEAKDAGRGMGLTSSQLLWRVEVPLAVPEIVAGLRVAATTTVGLATLAFFAGAGGLGEQIFADINFKSNVVTAGGLCVLLAVALDVGLLLVQRAATPWSRA